MIKINDTEYQAIVITDKHDKVVCILDADADDEAIMVVEHKDYKAHFIDSQETDFDYLVYANDDIRIVNAKDKILS